MAISPTIATAPTLGTLLMCWIQIRRDRGIRGTLTLLGRRVWVSIVHVFFMFPQLQNLMYCLVTNHCDDNIGTHSTRPSNTKDRQGSCTCCTCGSRPLYQLVHLVDLVASCRTYVERIKSCVPTWKPMHVVHFFASNSFKMTIEAALVDLLKRLGGYRSTLVC